MPRTAAFDRDDVLERAMQRFWAHGYDGTSVSDLVAATGINRASMYAAFGDKRSLFMSAIEHYVARVSSARFAVLDAPGSARENLRRFFDDLVDFSLGDGRRLGCLLTNSAVEVAPHDAEIADVLGKSLRDVERAFARALTRARDAGEIPADREPKRLARFLVGVVQGLRVLARTNASRAALRDVVDTAMEALHGSAH